MAPWASSCCSVSNWCPRTPSTKARAQRRWRAKDYSQKNTHTHFDSCRGLWHFSSLLFCVCFFSLVLLTQEISSVQSSNLLSDAMAIRCSFIQLIIYSKAAFFDAASCLSLIYSQSLNITKWKRKIQNVVAALQQPEASGSVQTEAFLGKRQMKPYFSGCITAADTAPHNSPLGPITADSGRPTCPVPCSSGESGNCRWAPNLTHQVKRHICSFF